MTELAEQNVEMLFGIPMPKEDDDVAWLSHALLSIAAINVCEKYYVEPVDIDDKEFVDETASSAELMVSRGLLHLPNKYCYVEMPVEIAAIDDKDVVVVDRVSVIMHETDDAILCEPYARLTRDLYALGDGHLRDGDEINFRDAYHWRLSRGWFPALGAFKIRKNTLSETGEVDVEYLRDTRSHITQQSALMPMSQRAIKVALAFIVLMHTKGMKCEGVKIPERLNKARLKSRKVPMDDFHILRVGEHSEGQSRGSCSERHRVRLHMRRGHLREQRHGKGNSKVKTIYIEPTIVGYQEEGRVYKEYDIDTAA